MKLKKQLKVKFFRNKWEKTLLNFQLCNSNINAYIRDCFRESPITYTQYLVLKILQSAGEPVNMLFLKERLVDNDSDMSRLITRLQDMGLVTKKPNASDKRHSDIDITKAGIMQLEEINEGIHAIDEVFFNLSTKEVKQLNTLLDKVRLG
jgi:DNA-binding MarR family transcriptional regulator